ncbi:hypothetical protein PGT21_011822 [Puccinia graminis f. sp. tritici]|uniref:Uncharacterized protein n=1 Tax=Puccinia graminis f. sp. tritici TaxID=56615 RepID=A0A5B0NN66_PUCGR|nr:hypothetical protein PGT21_011822 [Puccinia graminis f. sp. tritici]
MDQPADSDAIGHFHSHRNDADHVNEYFLRRRKLKQGLLYFKWKSLGMPGWPAPIRAIPPLGLAFILKIRPARQCIKHCDSRPPLPREIRETQSHPAFIPGSSQPPIAVCTSSTTLMFVIEVSIGLQVHNNQQSFGAHWECRKPSLLPAFTHKATIVLHKSSKDSFGARHDLARRSTNYGGLYLLRTHFILRPSRPIIITGSVQQHYIIIASLPGHPHRSDFTSTNALICQRRPHNHPTEQLAVARVQAHENYP